MTYDVSSYHLLLVALGLVITFAYWLPRFVSGREPAASALLIGLGFAVARPVRRGARSGRLTEAVGGPERDLRRRRPVRRRPADRQVLGRHAVALDRRTARHRHAAVHRWRWRSRAGRLASMTIAGALLLGAVLAPTDPVLAGDVQVGPPLEGGEHPVRFTLTTEAGLNDGLAFPFVYLALAIAAAGQVDAPLLGDWLLWDVDYRIIVGTLRRRRARLVAGQGHVRMAARKSAGEDRIGADGLRRRADRLRADRSSRRLRLHRGLRLRGDAAAPGVASRLPCQAASTSSSRSSRC